MPVSRINLPLGSPSARRFQRPEGVLDWEISDLTGAPSRTGLGKQYQATSGGLLSWGFSGGFHGKTFFFGTNGWRPHCHSSRPPISPSPCSAGVSGVVDESRLRPCLLPSEVRRNYWSPERLKFIIKLGL